MTVSSTEYLRQLLIQHDTAVRHNKAPFGSMMVPGKPAWLGSFYSIAAPGDKPHPPDATCTLAAGVQIISNVPSIEKKTLYIPRPRVQQSKETNKSTKTPRVPRWGLKMIPRAIAMTHTSDLVGLLSDIETATDAYSSKPAKIQPPSKPDLVTTTQYFHTAIQTMDLHGLPKKPTSAAVPPSHRVADDTPTEQHASNAETSRAAAKRSRGDMDGDCGQDNSSNEEQPSKRVRMGNRQTIAPVSRIAAKRGHFEMDRDEGQGDDSEDEHPSKRVRLGDDESTASASSLLHECGHRAIDASNEVTAGEAQAMDPGKNIKTTRYAANSNEKKTAPLPKKPDAPWHKPPSAEQQARALASASIS